MNKLLRKLMAIAALAFIPAFAQTSFASHFMGGDLTYACVAPGIYVVQSKIYRDCTGATAPTSIILDIKPKGCTGGRSLTVPRLGSSRIGDPYCPSIPKTCSTVRENYEEVMFSTTVVFTAAELSCPGGIVISSTNNARPEVANLMNPQGDIYSEAYINTAAGINNNSAEFSPLNIPIPFFCVGQETNYSINAADADGDSLVYSLQTPLSAAGTPFQYKSYGVSTIYNSDTTKAAIVPGGTFSATYPMPAYKADWSLPMPITAVKSFVLDQKNGVLRFTPTHYTPSPPVQGLNKFAMVVQVDEYRKNTTTNVWVKVGHIRRDMLAIMVDCAGNVLPTITGSIANGAILKDTSVIYLRPNIPLTLQFKAADPDTADNVLLNTNVQNVLPGSAITYSTGKRPTGTITWTPTASNVRPDLYYFSVLIRDNGCPIIGSNIRTYAVRVSNTGGVTGITKDKVENAGFIAFPNPFTHEVSFKLNQKNAAQTIVIYNTLGQKIDQISLTGLSTANQSIPWTNASKFAAGSYVAKLISSDRSSQTIQFSKLQ